MVLAAARLPSSRSMSASSAARVIRGSLSWVTGSEARASHPSARATAGSVVVARRVGLKACRYSAARSVRADGRPEAGLVSAKVTVASASARLARECGARRGHFMSA
jgi:hypothetical protein